MIKNLERVALNVKNLEDAMKTFSDTLGIEFEKTLDFSQPDGTRIRGAISSGGVELVEEPSMELKAAPRSFHFRVDDLDAAKAHVEEKGGTVLSRFSIGNVEELVCNIYDLRIIFLTYEGDDIISEMQE